MHLFKLSVAGVSTYTINWEYWIRYTIINKLNNKEIYSAVYKINKSVNNSVDKAQTVNEIISEGYEKFIQDEEVQKILK